MINTTYLFIILMLFLAGTLYSQDSEFRISNDTMELHLDKKAHFTTSFGLYYFFYTTITIYSDTLPYPQLEAMLLSSSLGLLYEVYQGTSLSNADGFSKEDFYYNIMGIGFARFTHEVFLYFKDLI